MNALFRNNIHVSSKQNKYIYIYMIYQYQYRKKLFVILILILIRVFIIKNYFFYKNFLKKILNYISYWKYWFQKLIKSKTN